MPNSSASEDRTSPASSTAGAWLRRLLIPRSWWNEFAAAVEDTAIKAREIQRLRCQMERPTVDQVEIALHVFADRNRDLSEKGAMRQALQAAFLAFEKRPLPGPPEDTAQVIVAYRAQKEKKE